MRFAYLDESGDLAFKKLGEGSGTSDTFVVALLMLDDPIPVYAAIDDLKERFGMRRAEEFRFSSTSPERRLAFLHELRRHDVTILAAVVNKAVIAGRPETTRERLFYRDIVRRVLVRFRHEFNDTSLVFDQYIRGRSAQREFNAYLRQAVNTGEARRLRDINHRSSHANNLIQAADMSAGAIYRARSRGDSTYLRIIKPRIREIWDWDGEEDEF